VSRQRSSHNGSIASILANIFRPAIYDAPPFNGGNPFHVGYVLGPQPEPWRTGIAGTAERVSLNPQPLPPKVVVAIALADAHLTQVFETDRLAQVFGGKHVESGVSITRNVLMEIDDLCPRWPKWPFPWPPRRLDFGEEMMGREELLIFGSRFLAASALLTQSDLAGAAAQVGNKAMDLALNG